MWDCCIHYARSQPLHIQSYMWECWTFEFDLAITTAVTLHRIRLWESKCEIQTKMKIVYSNFFLHINKNLFIIRALKNTQSINIHCYRNSESVCMCVCMCLPFSARESVWKYWMERWWWRKQQQNAVRKI